MAGLSSITGGLGVHRAFRMMPYRTLGFPGSREARAVPAAMDQRFGYHHVPMYRSQPSTHNAILGLRPFIDRGNPILHYAQHQANRGVGPFKAGLDIYI